MNLGFTESDNMNQDFYAFCQEPDPLHQNNIFQQLVANSNAETNDFFDASGNVFGGMATTGGFAGLGMGTGLGVGDEHEGIEAGQILQALSAAEEQRTIWKEDIECSGEYWYIYVEWGINYSVYIENTYCTKVHPNRIAFVDPLSKFKSWAQKKGKARGHKSRIDCKKSYL